ncbi:transporter [bacterium]|nr:transporter [bacterium]
MKKLSVLCVALFLAQAASAQIIWRPAKTLSHGSFLIYTSNYITQFNKSYDWNGEKWVPYGDDRKMTYVGMETMFGVGLTDRIELLVNLPVNFNSVETGGVENSASGIGDMYLKTRVAVVPWTADRGGFTLVGAVRLASGDREVMPALGDGTTDFVVGGIFSSGWKSGFRWHLRAAYWLNGKTDSDTDLGDELKILAKLDRTIAAKLAGFVTYIPDIFFKNKDADGEAIDNSQKHRHYISAGIVWNPVKGLFIRPKATIPVAGEGGSLYSVKPLVDVWYSFALFK